MWHYEALDEMKDISIKYKIDWKIFEGSGPVPVLKFGMSPIFHIIPNLTMNLYRSVLIWDKSMLRTEHCENLAYNHKQYLSGSCTSHSLCPSLVLKPYTFSEVNAITSFLSSANFTIALFN